MRKRMVPLDGYEESWLRRYESEMSPKEVEELQRRIQERVVAEPFA